MVSGIIADGLSFKSISLMAIASKLGYGIKVIVGSLVLLVMSIYNLISRYSFLIGWSFQSALSVGLTAARAVLFVVWVIGYTLKLTISVVFNPVLITFRIIDYNAKQFLNFVLGVLFDTKVEKLLTIEHGMEQFKVLIKWIQFLNVVCITGLILGLLTYYLLIRTICKWTEYEKSKTNVPAALKEPKNNTAKNEVIPEKVESVPPKKENTKESFINEFLKQERLSQEEPTVKQETEEDPSATLLTSAADELYNDLDYFPSETEEDDIMNYQSVNSLSGTVSASTSTTSISGNVPHSTPLKDFNTPTKSNFSPVTLAFRNRLLNSSKKSHEDSPIYTALVNEDEPYTLTDRGSTSPSSVFNSNRIPITPITTIEEDEEEDKW
jgi:hypothetical protein